MNKKKILNDPIYGFLAIPFEIVFDLIEHPYYQRLRRIQQLGLSSYVYPGAVHTRFHHAIGASHLMGQAIEVLRSKDIAITDEEAEGVTIAILLHDIGHGPFSHALEYSLLDEVNHERISTLFMEALNEEFDGRLALAIEIFEDRYSKRFLHQLVSSQLDMDRLDYLTRDSFFTGVTEGLVGYNRIIKMLNVRDDELVVEEKGIYSIEKFIVSRRLMYWQVYLHKTVLTAEEMLVFLLRRAKELARRGHDLFATPALHKFLYNDYSLKDFETDRNLIHWYSLLDDHDIWASMKVWQNSTDEILADLSRRIIQRQLFSVEISSDPIPQEQLNKIRSKIKEHKGLSGSDQDYYLLNGQTSNSAYSLNQSKINILYKNGEIRDIAMASDQLNIRSLSAPVVKHYLCYPKELRD